MKIIEVAKSLKGSRPIKDIVAEICKSSNGDRQYALKVYGDACTLYTQGNSENNSIIGYDIISTACMVVSEIERLSDYGIITVFQVNARESFTIGDSSLINGGTAHRITNENLVKYLKMDVYGGERLEKYIANGYKTDAEILAIENLETAKKTLQRTNCSVWVAVIVFILSAIVDIILQCCLH